jgi:hypothetical protein
MSSSRRRPGILTWFITMNGASLSKDMAQRVVPVKLSRPDYTDTWEREVADLLTNRRWEIIGDVLAALRAPAKTLAQHTRWALWESEVLARLADPDAALAEVIQRREAVDDDRDEADLVRDYFVAELRRRGHDPETQVIWITSAQVHPLVNAATGKRFEVNSAGKFLRGLAIKELTKCDRATGKGWLWQGVKAADDARRVPLTPSVEEQIRDLDPPLTATPPKAVAVTQPPARAVKPAPETRTAETSARLPVTVDDNRPLTGAVYLHGF